MEKEQKQELGWRVSVYIGSTPTKRCRTALYHVASCSTRTTTQRFYRPMPLLSLYLVVSLSSSSFSLDRQLCADTSCNEADFAESMVVTVKLAALREQLPSVFIDPCLYYRCTSYYALAPLPSLWTDSYLSDTFF